MVELHTFIDEFMRKAERELFCDVVFTKNMNPDVLAQATHGF
jgi:hypothetical protein